jgi:hypothetical protein
LTEIHSHKDKWTKQENLLNIVDKKKITA